MFLTPIVHFTIPIFIVILNVVWAPTGKKNATDILELICHYFVLAVYLIQGLMID